MRRQTVQVSREGNRQKLLSCAPRRAWRAYGAIRVKRQQAHDLLAPVYDWFTEGFETLDRKEAKALLDELA
jgi:hypothetical protein